MSVNLVAVPDLIDDGPVEEGDEEGGSSSENSGSGSEEEEGVKESRKRPKRGKAS